MTNPVKAYFSRPVRLLSVEQPAWLWMLGSFCATGILAVLAYTFFRVAEWFTHFSPAIVWVIASAFAIAFVALFLVMLRATFSSLMHFTIFTLLISAVSFAANVYILSHEVFPPFTPRTTWLLWIGFVVLALSVFHRKIPERFRYVLIPFLAIGALLCVAFILVLAPVMSFSWLIVWAGGLGFLPYSPLFAFLSFILSARQIHAGLSSKRLSWSLVCGTVLLSVSYMTYYKIEWDRAEDVLRAPAAQATERSVDSDLPEWIRKAGHLPVNHVTEMVLQPNRRSELSFFGLQTLFDPVAFICSGGLAWITNPRGTETIPAEDSGHLLHLLFGQSHAYLDRLWRGHSLITTNIDTHVQIHPDLRVAYTETTIAVFNEDPAAESRFLGLRFGGGASPEEAIYTITVPEGSICTKLSLWIDGQERPARLTFKSTARKAYAAIVGAERRDPSYVEWLDGNRLRLRVFPVEPQKFRTVRIGIVSPLKSDEGRLTYARAIFDGPVQTFAKQNVDVDIYSDHTSGFESTGIYLSKRASTANDVRKMTGRFARENWSVSLRSAEPAGTISAGGMSFAVRPLSVRTVDFRPEAVIVAVNDALPRARWIEIVRGLYERGSPVYLLTNEWFHTTELQKAVDYLGRCSLPPFNLFPLAFPANKGIGPVLWIAAGEEHSIPFGELRGSERFENTQKISNRRPDRIAIVNGRRSEYVASLIDLGKLIPVADSEASLFRVLREGKTSEPLENEDSLPLVTAQLQLERLPHADVRPGSDLLIRLMMRRKIMSKLGRRFFDRDLENGDLVSLARDGMIVSPVSTLIVLETENDYKRFGIGTDPSLLGESKLEPPGAVPEPRDWALGGLVLLTLALYAWRRRSRVRAEA